MPLRHEHARVAQSSLQAMGTSWLPSPSPSAPACCVSCGRTCLSNGQTPLQGQKPNHLGTLRSHFAPVCGKM